MDRMVGQQMIYGVFMGVLCIVQGKGRFPFLFNWSPARQVLQITQLYGNAQPIIAAMELPSELAMMAQHLDTISPLTTKTSIKIFGFISSFASDISPASVKTS